MAKPGPTQRRLLLDEAANIVDGDRNVSYGDPNDDFRKTAQYWSIHAGGVFRRKLEELSNPTVNDIIGVVDQLFDPHDVAIMMTQLKISRMAWSPTKKDHWLDGAGYMACGWDCVDGST
jgi:hypothetical protein